MIVLIVLFCSCFQWTACGLSGRPGHDALIPVVLGMRKGHVSVTAPSPNMAALTAPGTGWS